MKKQDLLIAIGLFALLLAWPLVYSKFFPLSPKPVKTTASPPRLPATEAAPEQDTAAPGSRAREGVDSFHQRGGSASGGPADTASPLAELGQAPRLRAITVPETRATDPFQPRSAIALRDGEPEKLVSLTNANMALTFSSRGGGLIATKLLQYRQTVDKRSSPVVLDFSNAPALSYSGLPELSAADNFSITPEAAADKLRLEKTTAAGLRFTREISFGSDYQIIIADTFRNESRQIIALPECAIQVGSMRLGVQESKTIGIETMGIDVLHSSEGEGVKYFAGDLPKLFKEQRDEDQRLPRTAHLTTNRPTDWVAVKSKFFVQILAPEGGIAGYQLSAERALAPGESEDPSQTPKSAEVQAIAAQASIPSRTLNPGEAASQSFSLYSGPKKYSCLSLLGLHQEEVMNFGFWTPVCKLLLLVLNATYAAIPNYGIAIILLTILIRVLFWPLTHKSTESMKRMQELQPLIMELRKKHKDSPRKLQEETMALYKQHKVNPVSGCLPMLIQVPVFIALFVVLRSAIELRFADFLWIRDLSEPERLFADYLPIPLNILPIFMAATQAWQQSMTPATDAAQQKMLLWFMPVMMLVMFYMMPSALVLYWSTNTVIMVAQQLIQKKRAALKK
ncbi:MAG: membrane protein insertase YidC [Lentisphaerae bacterium]|nr:membrane protein insertase YidC [Lentisphaerota bacterium]